MNVNPAHLSKINWTQVVAAAASVTVVFGLDIPLETQVAIVTGIQLATNFATLVFRTFMTKK